MTNVSYYRCTSNKLLQPANCKIVDIILKIHGYVILLPSHSPASIKNSKMYWSIISECSYHKRLATTMHLWDKNNKIRNVSKLFVTIMYI